MKRSKRLTALILAAAMLVIVGLAGCGKKTSEEPYTIDCYFVTGQVPTEGAKAEVETEVNKYLAEKNLNAKLNMHYLDWGSYGQKINVMIAGGEKFDFCYAQGDTYLSNAAKKAYMPINDLIDKYAPKTKEILGEEFLKGAQINGVNYGIPSNKDRGSYPGMLYRTDIAEKYGLTDKLNNVKTFDDVIPILEVIKEKEPDMAPLYESGVYSVAYLFPFDTFAFPAGIKLNGDGTKVVNYVETSEYREASIRTSQNLKDGYIHKGEKLENENHFMEFVTLKPGKDKEVSASRKYEYTQIDTMGTPYMQSGSAKGTNMAVSRTCKNPEVVMQFMELFNTDKYLHNLIVYGIEGKNYKKIDENTIDPIKNSGYGNAGMQWEFGNTFIDYLTVNDDPDKVTKMEEFNNNLTESPAFGFTFDSEKVKIEVGACQNVQAEFEKILSEGCDNPEKVLNDYIAKLKAAGSDKIVAEAQRQYDEWRAANGK